MSTNPMRTSRKSKRPPSLVLPTLPKSRSRLSKKQSKRTCGVTTRFAGWTSGDAEMATSRTSTDRRSNVDPIYVRTSVKWNAWYLPRPIGRTLERRSLGVKPGAYSPICRDVMTARAAPRSKKIEVNFLREIRILRKKGGPIRGRSPRGCFSSAQASRGRGTPPTVTETGGRLFLRSRVTGARAAQHVLPDLQIVRKGSGCPRLGAGEAVAGPSPRQHRCCESSPNVLAQGSVCLLLRDAGPPGKARFSTDRRWSR